MPVKKQIILNQEEDSKKPAEEALTTSNYDEASIEENMAAETVPDKLLGDDLTMENAKNKKKDKKEYNNY